MSEEIETLKKRLAEKEAEAAKLSVVIAEHDAAIVKVRNKFSRQLGRVSKKDLALKENRNEWEADTKALQILKESHEKEVEAHSEQLLKHDQLMKKIRDELSIAEKLETIVADELDTRKDVLLEENLPEILEQQAMVVECQVAVDEAKEELCAALAVFEGLREEVIQIEKRIPLLEEEKRAAVSHRDFKAAGKASKEIKEAAARYVCSH